MTHRELVENAEMGINSAIKKLLVHKDAMIMEIGTWLYSFGYDEDVIQKMALNKVATELGIPYLDLQDEMNRDEEEE
jgi:hypothetical protein